MTDCSFWNYNYKIVFEVDLKKKRTDIADGCAIIVDGNSKR